ncbi:FRG domain-containing protein [Enterobacter chuandaensis]|uniref:FRG domain-containing protein n=1 Tax=Enterobacter chuandaensis TaxID=2497875 RepID=UPI002FD4A87F
MVQEHELGDWVEFRETVGQMFGGSSRYVFRGQSDREWKLESTLTRLAQKVSVDFNSYDLEEIQKNNFRMRIRGLRGSNPSKLTDEEIWCLGQHYGLCTPLLDWSESPYIAAYFAYEKVSTCLSGWRTIFALDRLNLAKKIKEMGLSDEFKFIQPLQDDNKRIIAQAGLFTKIPTNTDLEAWLIDKGLESYLIKLHVENDYRLDAINDLKLMNIIGSTIYPDLHGASMACNMLIENISENHELRKNVYSTLKVLFPEKYS